MVDVDTVVWLPVELLRMLHNTGELVHDLLFALFRLVIDTTGIAATPEGLFGVLLLLYIFFSRI